MPGVDLCYRAVELVHPGDIAAGFIPLAGLGHGLKGDGVVAPCRIQFGDHRANGQPRSPRLQRSVRRAGCHVWAWRSLTPGALVRSSLNIQRIAPAQRQSSALMRPAADIRSKPMVFPTMSKAMTNTTTLQCGVPVRPETHRPSTRTPAGPTGAEGSVAHVRHQPHRQAPHPVDG